MYPKAWKVDTASLTGGVFYATGGDDVIYVCVRPATQFSEAASTFLADLIAAKGMALVPSVESDKTKTLADGKTQASEILLSAAFGMAKAYVHGTIKDGKAIMVMTGTKPANLTLYKEIGETLSIK
jgi:hypothetical protein